MWPEQVITLDKEKYILRKHYRKEVNWDVIEADGEKIWREEKRGYAYQQGPDGSKALWVSSEPLSNEDWERGEQSHEKEAKIELEAAEWLTQEEILKIAEEAARKRGYTIYEDFAEAIEKKKRSGWREGQLLYASAYPVGGLVYDIREKAAQSMPSLQWVVKGEIRVFDIRTAQKTLKEREFDYSNFGRIYYDIHLDDKVGRITNLFVIDEARKSGAGTDLVRLAERRMKDWGAEKSAGSSLPEARGFWEKLGYRLKGYSEVERRLR